MTHARLDALIPGGLALLLCVVLLCALLARSRRKPRRRRPRRVYSSSAGRGSGLRGAIRRALSTFERRRREVVVRVRGDAAPALALARAHVRSAARKLALSPLYAALAGAGAARKTLVLDLDETLVHAALKRGVCDVRLDIADAADAVRAVFYVRKRPYLDEFLRTTAQWYDIAIYTASQRTYADPLISTLDRHRVIQRRLFRDHCALVNGNYVKDLTRIQPNLSDVLIVDNSPAAYQMNPANALPIAAWYSDPDDEQLLGILPLLHALSFLDDVRSVLQLRLTGGALVPHSRK